MADICIAPHAVALPINMSPTFLSPVLALSGFIASATRWYGYPMYRFFQGATPVGFWDDSSLYSAYGTITQVRANTSLPHQVQLCRSC